MQISDFRSDTVTRPTEAMRRAMAEAEVGDDVFEDDPTVRKLEERVADLFGRDASLYCPTGTMANQIALGLCGSPGDEVLFEELSHSFHFEVGGPARLWGLTPRLYSTDRGLPDPAALAALVRPDNVHLSPTTVCVVENTHNFHGGRVVPVECIRKIREALPQNVSLHLDGARIWNALAATGTPLAHFAEPCRTVMAAFSKGLGCPAGSVVVGHPEDLAEARRLRKLLGGGMRQVGVLAATALVALDEGFDHLLEDHSRAQRLAEGFDVDPGTVDTNIVIAEVADGPGLEAKLREEGVLIVALGPKQVRLVTHRDVGDEDVERALLAFERVS